VNFPFKIRKMIAAQPVRVGAASRPPVCAVGLRKTAGGTSPPHAWRIFSTNGPNKKGGHFRDRLFSETFFSDRLGLLRFPDVAHFAQSLRKPFSPRSSEPIVRRLAKALLRAYAPEVKKKFPRVRKEKRDTYF
jgi:hypothetical protein